MRELFLIESNTVIRYTDIAVSQLQETLESSDGLFWFDIEQMTDEDVAFFGDFKKFQFHQLTIADCRSPDVRPKINEYPECLFLVLYVPEDNGTDLMKLCLFLTPDFLITVHPTPIPFLQNVKNQIEQDNLMMRSPGYCLAMVLEAVTTEFEEGMIIIESEVTDMELGGAFDRETVYHINRRREELSTLQRTLSIQADMLRELYSHPNPQLQPDTIIRIRDLYHRTAYMVDSLDTHRERLSDFRDGAVAGMTARMYGSTTRATTIATIFLPLICVAALLGMNREILGFSPPVGFAVALTVLAVIAGIIAMATGREE